jgi:hypothetical protein
VPAEHVRFAVYHDGSTLGVQANCSPAFKTQSRSRLNPTTSVPALLHVISELFEATKSDMSAANEQCFLFGPRLSFGNQVFGMRWAGDDGTEVAVRAREVGGDMKLELVDYT